MNFLIFLANEAGIPQYFDLFKSKFTERRISDENIKTLTLSALFHDASLIRGDSKLHKYQKNVIDSFKMEQKNRYVLTAPTSFGKTFLVYEIMEARGVNAQIMEIHTLKPIDREAVITAAGETGAIVTVEDHSVIGGLGGAVAEVLATNLPVSMRMIGIQDCFARSGDAEALYEANHMTAADIVAAAEELVERKKIR